jgi:hypothetical protein
MADKEVNQGLQFAQYLLIHEHGDAGAEAAEQLRRDTYLRSLQLKTPSGPLPSMEGIEGEHLHHPEIAQVALDVFAGNLPHQALVDAHARIYGTTPKESTE